LGLGLGTFAVAWGFIIMLPCLDPCPSFLALAVTFIAFTNPSSIVSPPFLKRRPSSLLLTFIMHPFLLGDHLAAFTDPQVQALDLAINRHLLEPLLEHHFHSHLLHRLVALVLVERQSYLEFYLF
jgi:hypothetical protein